MEPREPMVTLFMSNCSFKVVAIAGMMPWSVRAAKRVRKRIEKTKERLRLRAYLILA